jgi:hypothetical protein
LTEAYVPVENDDIMARYESLLFSDMKKVNARNAYMMVGAIVRHYANNPFDWEPIPMRKRGMNGMPGEIEMIYPTNIPAPETLLEKEKILIAKCQEAKERGRKLWIYTDFTGEGHSGQYMTGSPIPERLKALLDATGLRTFILRPSTAPIERKELIEKNRDKYDIFISNPKLVQEGINMAWCPSYIVYMPSFEVNVIDQAVRRGYRANSELDNEITYLYYSNSKEKEICERMQLKKAESKAIEAKFNLVLNVARTASAFSAKINDAMEALGDVLEPEDDGEVNITITAQDSTPIVNVASPEKEFTIIAEKIELRDSTRKSKKNKLAGDYVQLEFAFA